MQVSFSTKKKAKIGTFEIDQPPMLDISFLHGGKWYKIIEIIDSENVLVKTTDEDGQ